MFIKENSPEGADSGFSYMGFLLTDVLCRDAIAEEIQLTVS